MITFNNISKIQKDKIIHYHLYIIRLIATFSLEVKKFYWAFQRIHSSIPMMQLYFSPIQLGSGL
jgi:hypothetical protein